MKLLTPDTIEGLKYSGHHQRLFTKLHTVDITKSRNLLLGAARQGGRVAQRQLMWLYFSKWGQKHKTEELTQKIFEATVRPLLTVGDSLAKSYYEIITGHGDTDRAKLALGKLTKEDLLGYEKAFGKKLIDDDLSAEGLEPNFAQELHKRMRQNYHSIMGNE